MVKAYTICLFLIGVGWVANFILVSTEYTGTYDLQDVMVGYYRMNSRYPKNLVTEGDRLDNLTLTTYQVLSVYSKTTGRAWARGNSISTDMFVSGEYVLNVSSLLFPLSNWSVCYWVMVPHVIYEKITFLDWGGTNGVQLASHSGNLRIYYTFNGVSTYTTYVYSSSYGWVSSCWTFEIDSVKRYVKMHAYITGTWDAPFLRTMTVDYPSSSTDLLRIWQMSSLDDIRIFKRTLSVDAMEGVWAKQTLLPELSIMLNCPLSLTCEYYSAWPLECVCVSGYYRSATRKQVSLACSNPANSNSLNVVCKSCITSCPTDYYLFRACVGDTVIPSKCNACSKGVCKSGYYKLVCEGLQDSSCTNAYTQCPTDQYLDGWTEHSDGVCKYCTLCENDEPETRVCSNYLNRICGVSCNLTKLELCSDPHEICQKWSATTDKCVRCPAGFLKDNNMCLPCPPNMICTSSGTPTCTGGCPNSDMPFCTQESPFFKCDALACSNYSYINNNIPLVNNVNDRCDGFPLCPLGYYWFKNISHPVYCRPCNQPTGSLVFITPGLFLNSADSCIWQAISSSRNIGNKMGFYSSASLLCPNGLTSEPSNALTVEDCKPCPDYPFDKGIVTDFPTCTWTCKEGYIQTGLSCSPKVPSSIGCQGEGLAIVNNACEMRAFPWQPAGRYSLNQLESNVTNFTSPFQRKSIVLYKPWVRILSEGVDLQGPSGIPYYTKDPYLPMKIIYTLNKEYNLTFPAPPLSLAHDLHQNITYITFRGTSIIFYYIVGHNMTVFMGANITGYKEGFRHEARFGRELYLSTGYTSNTLWVLDTEHCMIRLLIPGASGPSDFRSRSYWVYGSTTGGVPTCVDLKAPRFFFPLQGIYPKFIAFVNDQSRVCQLHTLRQEVDCSKDIFVAPEGLEDLGILASLSGLLLTLEYPLYFQTISNPGIACPFEYTSLSGGICSQYAPFNNGMWDNGYFISSQGVATLCSRPSNCSLGYYPGYCSYTSQAECIKCSQSIVNQSYRYIELDSCLITFTSPCPINMYADDVGDCQSCPGLMYTSSSNQTSLDSCQCPSPLVKVTSPLDCVVPTNGLIFPEIRDFGCKSTETLDPIDKTCKLCNEEPCTLFQPHQYITSCHGEVFNCQVIPNSYFLTNDYSVVNETTGMPVACIWECNEGYTKVGNTCFKVY